MHESRLVRDLVTRAQTEAGGAPVTRMVLRLGALSPVSPAALEQAIVDRTSLEWGRAPAVDIELSQDPADVRALDVVLVSIGIGSL
ncbi:MAG: hypothetical protein WB239_09125 [Acidimicrobiia bacterium]